MQRLARVQTATAFDTRNNRRIRDVDDAAVIHTESSIPILIDVHRYGHDRETRERRAAVRSRCGVGTRIELESVSIMLSRGGQVRRQERCGVDVRRLARRLTQAVQRGKAASMHGGIADSAEPMARIELIVLGWLLSDSPTPGAPSVSRPRQITTPFRRRFTAHAPRC